jgi:4-hydroxybenzoate polyprenyltransferase
MSETAGHYLRLMRLDRPVGTLLLLWPTLAALWLAADGMPPWHLVIVFAIGTLVMRSAGCVINDYADRDWDRHVQRTAERPLTAGRVSTREALVLFLGLSALGLVLLIFLNPVTRWLAVGGFAIAVAYPFMKRWTYLPQVVLGAAFSWGLLMAYTSVRGELPREAGLLFVASVLWIVAYDTMYAMVDRDDDLLVGIKSTAILFGQADRAMIALLQIGALATLALFGSLRELGMFYHLGLATMLALFGYQHYLIRNRDRDGCLRAFLNNTWVGFALFSAVVLEVQATPLLGVLSGGAGAAGGVAP